MIEVVSVRVVVIDGCSVKLCCWVGSLCFIPGEAMGVLGGSSRNASPLGLAEGCLVGLGKAVGFGRAFFRILRGLHSF